MFKFFIITVMLISQCWAAVMDQRPTDQQISDAVAGQLTFDQFFLPGSVSISANNGIVTIKGSVFSLRSRDRAVEVAESIKGVKSIINQIKLQPTTKTDEAIKSDVRSALTIDPATDALNTQIDVKNHVATLTGTVNSPAEKNLTEWIVKGINGVLAVKNNLSITYSKQSDEQIAANVRDLLKKDPYLSQSALEVKVKDGMVNLSGVAPSAAAKRRALSIAWVTGAKGIVNDDVRVDPWLNDSMIKTSLNASQDDGEITNAVTQALARDPRISGFDPKAVSNLGTVTLNGVVDNLAAKIAAEEDAHNTLGVSKVENKLSVNPLVKISDEELRKSVQNSLSYNLPINRGERINLDVVNGSVKIYGQVDSPYLRNLAYFAAARVNGVKEVDDQLRVSTPTTTVESLKKKIQNQLFWDPHFNWVKDTVFVTVKPEGEKNMVILEGKVANWDDYSAATRDALSAGAAFVQNNLVVNNKKSTSTEDHFPVYDHNWYQTL